MGDAATTGLIFNIQRFSVHDGPGIRTTVFMKGCPLQCRWCANAESIVPRPELGVITDRCDGCGKCVDACPEHAITVDAHTGIRVDRDRCTACGECVPVCPPGALALFGREVSAEEVVREVLRDAAFFRGSGGGVTASGGEPLRQAGFVLELFQQCRGAGVPTCLDTTGYAPTERLQEVLAFTDYVLYDIKHMDPACHHEYTGVTNELILANARVAAASGVPMLVRIPLVAGVNDTPGNIAETARFVGELGNGPGVELLPYHRLGVGKYGTLGRPYPGLALSAPSPEQVECIRRVFEATGVPCAVGG